MTAARDRGEPSRPAPARRPAPVPLAGARVVVLGLGRFGGGKGAALWLAGEGAQVTVTDRLPEHDLAAPAAELRAAGVALALGGHAGVDLRATDLLVVNPAVPLAAPLVRAAREAGVALTSEVGLLLERWPGPVLGVTGSNGKSTTTTMAHALLVAAGVPAEAGGNLGGSLLPCLAAATRDTVAVLELSSFMLETLREAGLGPDVAIVTNLTPNHLDRHGTFEAYRHAKEAIFLRARAAVLNLDDPHVAGMAEGLPLRRLWFGRLPPATRPAAALPALPDLGVGEGGDLLDRSGRRVLASARVPLPGLANRLDLAAACLAVGALLEDPARHPPDRERPPAGAGRAEAALPAALAALRLPPHRLEEVGRAHQARWVDDSVSTTPESTAASLEATAALTGGAGCLLIAGGHDKGLDARPLVEAAARWCRLVLTVGEEGSALAAGLQRAGVPAEHVVTVERAVTRAAASVRPGETVLLSPGYSSHDQFANFTERGFAFRRAVARLAAPAGLSRSAEGC